ncbi:MAG: DNA methyltransferase [Thermoplasmatales archaeon]|nr:DNA methyltransferase [Thermoplasmatales archaeon]
MKIENINDIDMKKWKKYKEEDIRTDSLWIIGKRDNSGVHSPDYWGNFIPQIPRQAMLRFTKKNEWVLDPFLGSGTTLIECRQLGRNGVGVEIVPGIAENAKKLIEKEKNRYGVRTEVVVGDSVSEKIWKEVDNINKKFQLIIMHPPYWDIIKFSRKKNDLSNAKTLEDFLSRFSMVVKNTYPLLENERFLVLVIGDKYEKSEWIPLGFYCMENVLKTGYKLKSVVVKNMTENRGKRSRHSLWRYRALKGNFYVFRHEYVIFFEKTDDR